MLDDFARDHAECFDAYVIPLLHPSDIAQLCSVLSSAVLVPAPTPRQRWHDVVAHVKSFGPALRHIREMCYCASAQCAHYCSSRGGLYTILVVCKCSRRHNIDGTVTEYALCGDCLYPNRTGRRKTTFTEIRQIRLHCDSDGGLLLETRYARTRYRSNIFDVWKCSTLILSDLIRVYAIRVAIRRYLGQAKEFTLAIVSGACGGRDASRTEPAPAQSSDVCASASRCEN